MWSGVVMSIQPRVRLLRSFDQRSDTYLGYVVRLAGSVDGEPRSFAIAIGEAAHARHRIKVGTALSGMGVPVPDARRETAELYKIDEPFRQRDGRFFKDRPGANGELWTFVFGITLPPVHRNHVSYMRGLALRTLDHTIRPTYVSQEFFTTLPVGEVMNRVYQRLGVIP